MKKIILLLLIVASLSGYCQDIVSNDYSYFMKINAKIDSVVRGVLCPGIDSVHCIIQDSIYHRYYGDSITYIAIRASQDSLGKFHNVLIKVFSNCPAQIQYIEAKNRQIISAIEAMDPILIFCYEGGRKQLPKKELFHVDHITYFFGVCIHHGRCEKVIDFRDW